jgi:inorganic pyrophosphatase
MPEGNISRLRPFGPKSEYINVVIEAPKGSRAKFKYDAESGLFIFHKMLPIGQSFPFDFGFVPSTKAPDGDPLDALVLTDEPTFVGCLIHAKLLGVIEAEQTENGKTNRNDRLVAVPLETKSGKPPSGTIDHLELNLARKLTKFFVVYNELQDKGFKVLRYAGPDDAAKLIRRGMSGTRKRRKRLRR